MNIIDVHWKKININLLHSGMSCSNNCIKMYIHSGLPVLLKQALPKT